MYTTRQIISKAIPKPTPALPLSDAALKVLALPRAESISVLVQCLGLGLLLPWLLFALARLRCCCELQRLNEGDLPYNGIGNLLQQGFCTYEQAPQVGGCRCPPQPPP